MAREAAYCRPCDAQVVVRRASRGWAIALASCAAGMVALVIGASLIGPFVMFALPFMALFGFALGPLARLVTEPVTCPECHRELRWRHRDEVPAELQPRPRAERAARSVVGSHASPRRVI